MHPFWSSHEEKRVYVRLFMGGGYGRTLAPWVLMGARRRGEGEGEGGWEAGGVAWRGHGWEGPWGEGCRGAREAARLPSVRPVRAACYACVREKKRGRKERRKENEGKEKEKKIWKFF
jgi:hypothetical protein